MDITVRSYPPTEGPYGYPPVVPTDRSDIPTIWQSDNADILTDRSYRRTVLADWLTDRAELRTDPYRLTGHPTDDTDGSTDLPTPLVWLPCLFAFYFYADAGVTRQISFNPPGWIGNSLAVNS